MIRTMRFGLAGLALALPFRAAPAAVVPQENRSELKSLPPISESAPSNGEISVDFDTALNRTHVRYRTSLAESHGWLGILKSGPAVHTLIAVYEFAGRAPGSQMGSIQLSLMSTEFRQLQSDDRRSLRAEPIMAIAFGDSVASYPIGIAQRAEIWTPINAVSDPNRAGLQGDQATTLHTLPAQARIERTATVRIPFCDFLALIRGGDLHGTVAGLEFELSDPVMSGLREFATTLSPKPGNLTECK